MGRERVLIMIAGTLGTVGLLVSISSALLGGVSFPDFIVKSIVSAVTLAMLGVGIYFLLESKVPVVFEMLDEGYNETDLYDSGEDHAKVEDVPEETKDIKDDPPSETEKDDTLDYQTDMEDKTLSEGALNTRNAIPREGEIVVEGVTLKNEPEIMAEAIKTLLIQDKKPSEV